MQKRLQVPVYQEEVRGGMFVNVCNFSPNKDTSQYTLSSRLGGELSKCPPAEAEIAIGTGRTSIFISTPS
jgi:hypothetical protein